MKKALIAAIIVSLIMAVYQIKTAIVSHYLWEKEYSQLWSLADKSSTLTAKREYISQFVGKLQAGYANGDFSKHNALFLKTPNNAFEMNLRALQTLDGRLQEIEKMDPTSFQYNTAIQQITAQEQGEARAMMNVLRGCFFLSNYPLVWDWIGGSLVVIELAIVLLGLLIYPEL